VPGLVVFRDIRSGNGSGPFLQPRSPDATMLIVWQEGHPVCKMTERCYAHNDHVRIVLWWRWVGNATL